MLLVTGGSGRLGRELLVVFPEASSPSRRELDVLRGDAVGTFIRKHRPKAVVHAAAYTSVRGAEEGEEELCWNTNVRGTELLVEALQEESPECYFVYMSTACVFYGDRGFYSEEDLPRPKNFYGLTKLVGEYVARRMPFHLVVRTNFVSRGPWPHPKAFTDRFGTYLYADDVAHAIREVMATKMTGVVHIAGARKLSMFELARATSPWVEPTTMREVGLPLTVDMTLRSVRIAAYRLGQFRSGEGGSWTT